MHPVLFKIGWFEVHSYGLLLMLSFLLGIYIAVRRAKKAGINPNHIVDISIIIIISALVGARLMYVAFHLDEFRGHWIDMINPIQGDGTIGIAGLVLLGGIILAILSSFVYLKYKKLPVLSVFNVMIPSVALGLVIVRIGCFLHGCCFGIVCTQSWGVTFPYDSPAGFIFPDIPIHPTQLYASIGGAVIFVLLLLSEKVQFFKDKTFFTFLILYGISRFVVDIFRYYEESMILLHMNIFNVTLNQVICVALIIAGISAIVYISSKKTEQITKEIV